MKLKIRDMKTFCNTVFGAEYLLLYYPALAEGGVDVAFRCGVYYILDGNDTTFFSTLEIEAAMEFVE